MLAKHAFVPVGITAAQGVRIVSVVAIITET